MNSLHPIDRHLLFTKNDKEDPRLGECVQLHPKIQPEDIGKLNYDIAVLGYPDDDGISANGGRPGAQNAPRDIRHFLYKMTPHPQAHKSIQIADLGDLSEKETPLKERHEKGCKWTESLAQKGLPWIGLGGGHDYGYVDGAGFLKAHAGNAVILNFDAHMDVRSDSQGINSGTAFYRLLSEYKGQFDFAEIGIQDHCNSKFHIAWAQKHGATVIPLKQVEEQGLTAVLKDFLKGKEKKKIFLSLDIDAFNSMEAPGCSQSWTTGLRTQEFLLALEYLVLNFDICVVGLYEVSPPLDPDHRTCKLAALILHKFIYTHLQKVQK